MPPRQPRASIFYLDANLDGPELVRDLRRAGLVCEAHRDHFASDAEDEVWIPPIAKKGWIIVTRDVAIQRRRSERAAWTAARATVVMIRGEGLTAADMLAIVTAASPRLEAYISKRRPPMIIHLHAGGRFDLSEGGDRRGGHKK